MNIDIKNLIKEILEIKLENFSELYPKISHPYEISETKQKFKDFLKKCPPKSKHLEIAKPLKIEDSSKGIDRTTVKKSKHQKFDFLYDEVKNFNLKIKDENTCKNRNFDQSGETVQIIKTSSKKSLMGKRNYVEMKEKNSQNKPLHYFGFNERVLDDEGYDSEPNLNHIFAKYLENKEKSNKKKNYPYTEDEEEIDNYYILDKIKAKTLKENLEKKKQRNFFQKKNSILKKKLKAKNTKKEMKIFVYQEDRLKQRKKMIRKKNLKIEDETSIEIEDTLIIPTQILKYESDSDYKFNKRIKYENNSKNIKRKQTFIDESIDMEDYTLITSPTKIEERENTNFFIPKETIGKKKSSLTLINSFKLYEKLRNESLQRKNDIISEELTFESSIINCGSSLSLEELIKINRSLKKMKYCLQTHKLGIDDLNEIQTLISLISNLFVHKKIDKELFSNDKVFKTLVEEIKQILLTKAFSLFSLISLDSGTIYYKILIDFWGLLAKVIVELEANSFYPELKSFLLFYCQINFEAFYLKIIILIQMNCSLYDEFIENEKLFCCLLDFYSSIQEKTKIQILQETSNNFLSGIKKGIIKFQSLFASQNTEKQRKTIIEKLKTIKGIPFINFFFDNPNTPQENRFLEYIFWLYPYSNDQNYEQITSRIQTELTTFGLVLNQSLSLILLLFVELLPKTNFSEFITLFLENLFFSDIFPISSSTNLENSLKIFEYIFSNFGLETIYFLKLKEKIIQTILYKEFSNKFTSITRNDSSDLLEKMIMKFNNNDFSSSNISWELKLVCLFAKSLENEKSKTSISEIPFLEKRVFSRMLCSFKQYDKFHGDLLKNNEFIVFRLEFYLLNALVFLFQKEDLLLNAYRFSIKFLKNYENSHGFVKQMMFNFQRHLLLSIFRSVSKKEIRNNLEYLPEKFKIPVNELWVKFLGILRQFLDIGKFLQNFSLNPQNLTENERALEKNHIDLKENLEENIDLLKEMLKINPIIGKSFLENLTNTSGETSVLLCFKLDSIIFPSTRIKILEFLKEIYQNIENFEVWWEDYLKNDQENERKELDYEEILKEYKRKETFETQLRKIQIGFLETAGFVKLLEMICSM